MTPISTFAKWMALTAALLGWLFDGFEMGLFPLVARPALVELLTNDSGPPSDQHISAWLGIVTAVFLARRRAAFSSAGWAIDSAGFAR